MPAFLYVSTTQRKRRYRYTTWRSSRKDTTARPASTSGFASQAYRRPSAWSAAATSSVLADTAIRAQDIDEASVRKAKEEAERILANRGEAMEVAEAQQKLAEAVVQLQALERLRKTLKH